MITSDSLSNGMGTESSFYFSGLSNPEDPTITTFSVIEISC